MEKNQIRNPLILLLWVVASLLALSLVPEFTIGPFKFKSISILADLAPDKPAATAHDSIRKDSVIRIKPDTCRKGVTCIEDFGIDHKSLDHFLKGISSGKGKVRVAFFGDSFIEADIFCGALRDTLQQLFGGQGVGYVPLTSQVTAYRPTIQHAFTGWKTFGIVGDKSPFAKPGFSGYCFVPQEGNEVEFKSSIRRPVRFSRVRLFYRSSMPASLHCTLNDTSRLDFDLAVSDTLQQQNIDAKGAVSVKFNFGPYDSLKLYGASFEGPGVVVVDNLAMRGNSGVGLYEIETADIREFNMYQNYKLVILQYGLNVVTEKDSTGYGWYVDKMVRVIQRLKDNMPGCSFLLLSVSDRCTNQNGKFITMPNIPLMRDAQRQIAFRSKIAFWDLLAAMTGPHSMANLVSATPTLASKDYTHLNFAGGRILARKLAEALLYEREKHESEKKDNRH